MRGRSIDLSHVVTVLALGIGGCSDGGFAEFGGATTGAADDEGPGTSENPSPTAVDTTAGPGDTSGDSTGGDESGATPDFCDGVDCGGGGYCELDGEEQPVCVCDPGYTAYGLRCLSCSPTTGLLDVDIPTASVSATFMLNGDPFPRSFYDHGEIVLRDPITDDEVVLGSTIDGGTLDDVMVIPGNYELLYVRRAGGQQVPANESAMLGMVHIAQGGDPSLVVDVSAVELSGSIQMNSEAPPEGAYENGSIVLRNPQSGDEVVLGDTNDAEYHVLVIPGSYDVHYRRKLAEEQAPINGDARFATVEVRDPDGDGLQDISIDVPVTTLSGTFMLDGVSPPPGAYDSGRVVLRDVWTGDEVVLGNTFDETYQVPVVAGTYDVVYRRLLGGDLVPVNSAAVLMQETLESGPDTLDVDIETAMVGGTITVGGSPAPADPADDGQILLRNPQTGDEAVLGNTADGSYMRRVVRGSYDVYYRQETSSGGVPVNTNARLSSVDIMGGAALNVNVPVVTVSASVTVGGALPPESVYDDGLLYLLDPQTGDTVLLGNTRLASLQRPIVPGIYDLVYVVEAAGPTMPINAKSLLDTVDVNQAMNLMVDIPVVAFQGAITLEGAAPPIAAYDRAALLLHDVATADVIDLGTIDVGAFARTVNAGTYVLAYRALATTGMVPANTNAGVACVDIQAP